MQALVHQQLLVPLFHLLGNPSREEAFQDGGAHVCDPLLGQFGNLLIIGQVKSNFSMRSYEFCNVLYGKTLVLRNGDEAHIFAQDALLVPRHKVLQKLDGDLLYKKRPKIVSWASSKYY